jgi:AraC-like DNA-binding protein/DNA gyrase inhibitor GyrI
MNREHFVKAVHFIYEKIDQPLSLEEVAKAAGVSVPSLKRLFIEATDQSPGTLIRRLRMELAFRSLQNRNQSVIEVALASGFEDHSAFSRRFKKCFGYAPTRAREKTRMVAELENVALEEPEWVEVEEICIQSVTEKGHYFECAPKAWERLRLQMKPQHLEDDFSGLFVGIGHDNPHEKNVAEEHVRFSAGVGLLQEQLPDAERLIVEGGRYARFRYKGKLANLGLAYHSIFGHWANNPDWQINHSIPAFQVFGAFPDGFKTQEVFIYVPIRYEDRHEDGSQSYFARG